MVSSLGKKIAPFAGACENDADDVLYVTDNNGRGLYYITCFTSAGGNMDGAIIYQRIIIACSISDLLLRSHQRFIILTGR